MNNKLQSYKRRLRSAEKKMAKLQGNFPDVDLRNYDLYRAFAAYHELMRQTIYLSVDARFCASENRKEMCGDCTCWKIHNQT